MELPALDQKFVLPLKSVLDTKGFLSCVSMKKPIRTRVRPEEMHPSVPIHWGIPARESALC
jgi:hypothetical protein